MTHLRFAVVAAFLLSLALPADAFTQKQPKKKQKRRRVRQRVPEGVKVIRDLQYGPDKTRSLDLYLPQDLKTKPPLLVWIHGGGWRGGSKSRVYPVLLKLTGEGYAVASVEYRLNGLKGHPEHTHDCKGAIRWLRANAEKYGYNAKRIGIAGGSAGGHIVLMLGMTAGVKEMEGTVGGNEKQSSRVQAVVNLFGPTSFDLFAKENARFRGRYKDAVKLYKSASPLTYLSKDDAPVLTLHGTDDRLVPVSQAKLLHKKYKAAGLESHLHIIEGAGHGGRQFSDGERYGLVKGFLDRCVKGGKSGR